MVPSRTKIIFLLCLLISGVFTAAGQYRFDTWTTDNGLPQNGVRQITQTPDGYLWFTTFDGLVRFDGVRFTTFNKSNTKGIINNRFTGIFGDKDGTLYATTMEDGILTTYRNGVFSSLTSEQVPGHYIGQIERDATGELRFLAEDEDRTSRSWYRLFDGKFEFIEKQPKLYEDRVINGKTGTTWTIRPTGITEVKDGKTTVIALDLTKIPYRANVFESSDGALWLGENRVHRVRDGQVRTFDEKDGLPRTSLYHSFWQEPDGSVWLSSGGASSASVGLVQINEDKITLWGSEHGLLSSSIASVYNDREGNTWLATDRGLSRRRKQVIQSYSTNDGLDHSEIYPLYRDSKNDIWLGSSKGLSVYRNGKFQAMEIKSPANAAPDSTWRPGRMSVQSLWEDPNGKMWVGLSGGIFLVENGKAEILFKGSHVFAIKGDRSGNVWAATNKGILRFNDYKPTAEYSVKDGLPNEFMTFIFEDSKGSLWFGGFGGLSKFEDGRFTNYTKNEGLAGNYVRTVYEDAEGTFWIGTYDEGLSRFKDGRFVSYREENGLYSNGAFAIEEDAAGYFWISSNRGIYRVKRRDLDDFADGKTAKINSVGYGKADGMLSNECNGGRQPASLRDEDGKFWFPTQNGVAVVDPKAETPNPLPPSVVVEEVLVARQPVDFHGGLVIEPGQKDVEIRFTGISLVKSDQIKFKYKLEGHDEDWIDAENRRTAYYSFLPPGKYNFLVQAANSDGVWSEKGAELRLDLMPFFYQTKLFMLLAVLGAAIALLIIWKVSVYQLEARERKLARLVAERTAELADANKILQDLANSDGLTKIGNRRRFETFLADEWHRAVRFKTAISLVMIDIDHFKSFNDAYGHQAGDDCLQKVAEAFAETIKRPTDLVARFGGEEFAVVLGGTDASGAFTIAEQAVANVNALMIPHSQSLTSEYVTVSVGIATIFATLETSETDLIKAADRALYQAKENGRDQIFAADYFIGPQIKAPMITQDHLDLNPN
ncbi:MAG: diguanylate cyclase [Acidobacteria bacterium]|nr:diguanylate cyclase [Acidobacteriota bacterium]